MSSKTPSPRRTLFELENQSKTKHKASDTPTRPGTTIPPTATARLFPPQVAAPVTPISHPSAEGASVVSAAVSEPTTALVETIDRDLEGYAKIEVCVKCRNLKKMDWTSKSDPFCVVHITEGHDESACLRDHPLSKLPSKRSRELGRTEVIRDNQNPDFSTSFQTHYVFEEIQTLLIRVYDEDKKAESDLTKHDFQGSVSVTLAELMSAPGNSIKLPLERNRGLVIVNATEVVECNDELLFKFAGSNLINKDGWRGASDPFAVISRMAADGDYTPVWKSEVIQNNLNPKWKVSRLPVQKLCNSDFDRPLRIQIFDWDKRGSHDDMGSVHTSLRDLTEVSSLEITCDGKAAGRLLIEQALVRQVPSFLEYMSGGCELHFMAAVDFSSSNGRFTKRDSLHFIDRRGFANDYQAALSTVGDVLQYYGAERSCPLYGFGAKLGEHTEHCFQILDPEGESGLDATLASYKAVFSTPGFTMSEPTLFAPVIKAAASNARELAETNEQAYTVLLLITDGEINDIDLTIDALVQSSNDPLSIIIVGVGGGDFTNMERLDSDKVKMRSSRGITSTRDIVQFVPFRAYSQTRSRLAAETLAEIPSQLVSYFMSKGIAPSEPLEHTVGTQMVEHGAPNAETSMAAPTPVANVDISWDGEGFNSSFTD